MPGSAPYSLRDIKFVFRMEARNDKGRTLFVAVFCDGYLVAGPMWADEAEAEYELIDNSSNIRHGPPVI